MSLPNTTLWGDILPGGPLNDTLAANLDTTQVIDELLPTLHAVNRAALAPWSEADLIQWLDESVQRLARTACVFVGRSTAILTAPGQATYTLPASHAATLHVSYGTAGLRPANTIELEARDTAYRTAQGTPTAWYEDLLGLSTIGLAKVPNDAVALPIIYEGWPAALDTGKQNTLIPAPTPLKAYLAMAVLAEAYGREGEMESQDIAAHCTARLNLYDTMLKTYYGEAV